MYSAGKKNIYFDDFFDYLRKRENPVLRKKPKLSTAVIVARAAKTHRHFDRNMLIHFLHGDNFVTVAVL